jgi:flagellar motor switch protein FliG
MSLSGKQKAALLLMSLDAATAAQMVKGLDSKAFEELAVELAYLEATGYKNSPEGTQVAMQFYSSLSAGREFRVDNFLNELLVSSVGEAKAKNIQQQIQELLRRRDPFISIRSVDAQTLSSVLSSEHPQAVAVILSELPAKKSSEVLSILKDDIRQSAVGRMAGSETITAEAKMRIAQTICERLEAIAAKQSAEPAAAAQPKQSLRKIAVILRNLGTELRQGLLDAIKKKDSGTGEMVANLMLIWEDIPQVSDRSLQEGLRGIDSRKMALALHKADGAIVSRIRANISERAAAALDEETSLMKAPKKEDIEAAREEMVQILRQMNQKGELAFIEE